MAEGSFSHERQQFAAKAADFSRAILNIVSEDVQTWDVFRWVVIVLLALNLLLLLSLGGIRSEIAALRQDRSAAAEEVARAAEEVARAAKEIADTRAALTQSISNMRSGLKSDIAKVNTKLDVLARPAPISSPPPAAASKPPKRKPR
jgi:methyl-accepting chemotaxis protein